MTDLVTQVVGMVMESVLSAKDQKKEQIPDELFEFPDDCEVRFDPDDKYAILLLLKG